MRRYKILLIFLVLGSNQVIVIGQSLNNKTKGTHTSDGQYYKTKQEFFSNNCYNLKFDKNFKPYAEITIVNTFIKKTITTLIVKYKYVLDGKEYIRSQMIHQIIKPNKKSIFNIYLMSGSAKELSDFELRELDIPNVRFINGSISEHPFIVGKKDLR